MAEQHADDVRASAFSMQKMVDPYKEAARLKAERARDADCVATPFYESILRCPEPHCGWRIEGDDPDRYWAYSKHYRAQHNDGAES